jgi:hypothetical protein
LNDTGSQPVIKQKIVSYSIKIGVLITVVDLLIEREQGNQKKAFTMIKNSSLNSKEWIIKYSMIDKTRQVLSAKYLSIK